MKFLMKPGLPKHGGNRKVRLVKATFVIKVIPVLPFLVREVTSTTPVKLPRYQIGSLVPEPIPYQS